MELKELKHLPKAWKRGTDFLGTATPSFAVR